MQTQPSRHSPVPFRIVRGLIACALISGFSPINAPALFAPALFAQGAPAATPPRKDKVTAEAHLSTNKLPPGQECRILIRLKVQPGWHINTNPAKPKDYIATEVSFQGKRGTKLVDLKYPAGKEFRLQGADEPLHGYEGQVDIYGKLQVPAEAAGLTEEMEIVVKYQACDDRTCLLPTTFSLKGSLPVAKAGEAVSPVNSKLFKDPPK